MFRSGTKENVIRSGKVKNRRVVNSVQSNPYEVSQYTINVFELNYYCSYDIEFVMNECSNLI